MSDYETKSIMDGDMAASKVGYNKGGGECIHMILSLIPVINIYVNE